MEAELICFFFIWKGREYMRYKNGNPKKCSRFICLHCLQENFVVDGLQRRHQRPNNHVKTKQIDGLIDFAGNKACILSVKADGLSTTLRYLNGKLVSAETRGTGDKGYDCYHNVLTIKNIPKEIDYKDELIIDGETIIGWDTFQKINDSLTGKKYEHPRNLVSGSLTMLDSREAAKRDMRFVVWRVIKGFGHKSVFEDLKEAEKNGFEIIPLWTYTNNSSDKENLQNMLENLQNIADEKNIPYDGAVLAIDDYKLAESTGRTDKFFRHSIAYKYEDELYETNSMQVRLLGTLQKDSSKTYAYDVAGMKIKCEEEFVNRTESMCLIFSGKGKVLNEEFTFEETIYVDTDTYDRYDWNIKNGILYVTLYEKINPRPDFKRVEKPVKKTETEEENK